MFENFRSPFSKKLAETPTQDAAPAPQEDLNAIKEVRITIQEEVGSSGTSVFAGYFDEEYLPDLRGYKAAEVYDKMRRGDARVKMVLNAVLNPIKGATWDVEKASDTPDDIKIAEFVKHVIFNDSGKPWKERLSEMLSLVPMGHVVYEVNDTVVLNHPKFGSYNGIHFGFRGQKTLFRWNLDKFGKILSLEQNAYGDLERLVEIPGESLLIMTLDKEGDNFEGVSGLRACYGSWYRKQVYLKLMAIGTERNAVPTPKVKFPPGFENKPGWAQLIANLKKYNSNQQNFLMYPNEVEIDFSTTNFSSKEVKESIQFENEEMSYAFLQNFLLLGGSGSSGSFALSNDLSDFFLSGIEHVASIVCEKINLEIIPTLVKKNFGPQLVYPKLTCSGISDKAGLEFSQILKNLADSKYITPDDPTEDSLRNRLGLPKKSNIGKRVATPAPAPGAPTLDTSPQLSEKKKSFQLADKKKPKRLISESSNRLTPFLREELRGIGSRLVEDLMKAYRNSTPATRLNAYKNVSSVGASAYKASVQEWLAEIAAKALSDARKEVPKAKNVSLSEEIKLSEFDRLPPKVQKRIKAQSELMVTTQLNDLEKSVFFKYTSNVENVMDSEDLLQGELTDSMENYVEGAAIETGATGSVSTVVNEARNAFFFDDQTLDEVESFTFVNGDPVSEICQDLAGRTFAKDDPEAERYFPPLHFNCKSYISPNLKGDGSKIDDRGLKPSTAKIEGTIQFQEKV